MAGTEKPSATKKPPKGGRKGGTLFPKINLQQVLDYAKKLVAKTHVGPLPEKTILPGVFANAGAGGKVRASALKQFGLMQGDAKAYEATQLAKDIDACPSEDRQLLLKSAFLSSKLFSEMFTVFNGDSVAMAKIEQRAKGLKVHPESAEECARIFAESAVTAGLGLKNGELITFVAAVPTATDAEPRGGGGDDVLEQLEDVDQGAIGVEQGEARAAAQIGRSHESQKSSENVNKAGVTVNLNVDSSSDPDKLEKQLKLLREFGVI